MVTALIVFPDLLRPSEETDEPGGLPLTYTPESRVPSRHGVLYEEIPVMLEPHPDEASAGEFRDCHVGALRLLVQSGTFEAAFDIVRPVVDSVLDGLAFQMQCALHIMSFDLLDATEPLNAGEERRVEVHANPDANVAPKFSTLPPDFTWVEYAVETPSLNLARAAANPKHKMALWWYVKAMDAQYAIDKFVHLWTAVEILWSESDVRVTEPYTVESCKHAIESCPECGGTVAKLVRGASIRQYLTDRVGVPEADAREMWRIRQAVHGENVFTPQRLDSLGRLVTILRAAVLLLLKQVIGYPLDERPALLSSNGPILSNLVTLGGHRPIDGNDVEVIRFLSGTVPPS